MENCTNIGMQIKNIMAKENLEPNFIANWNVHQHMLIKYEYINGDGIEKYPYIHMFAKVYTNFSDN